MLTNSARKSHRISRSSSSTVRSSSRSEYNFIGEYAGTAIPGYGGHVPGIDPESRFGASRKRIVSQVYLDRHRAKTANSSANIDGLGFRPGYDIVGYTGFVPGKHSDNVFGQTFSRSNLLSQEIKRSQYSKEPDHHRLVTSALQLFDGTRPSNQYGNFPLYSKPQNRVISTS